MTTGLRAEEVRGLEALARRQFVLDLFTLATAQNAPPTIDPDDAGALGVVARFAKEDHQHGITTGTPAALTKTATSAESAGTGFARDVHVHATDVLPWGLIARQVLTSTPAAYTVTTTTDFALANVPVVNTRAYMIHLHTHVLASAATGLWALELREEGTKIGEMHTHETDTREQVSSNFLWLPSTTGDRNLDIVAAEAGGAVSFQLVASATAPRMFWVTDIGLR